MVQKENIEERHKK